MSEDLATMTREAALAALAWQIEMGADEAILDGPVDRFSAPDPRPVPASATAAETPAPPTGRPAAAAPAPHPAAGAPVADGSAAVAGAADSLAALRAAMAAFEGCALKKGARNLVFADGLPGAHVMIVGEAPGRDEDREGLPFVGASGRLLDLMFAAIGRARRAEDPARGLYITNTMPWRPPQNRTPSEDELAMMLPFLRRHIELAAPRLLVTMGNPATKALLDTSTGITRLRGRWTEVMGIPTLPMFHPAALLRDPIKKRESWADLLAIEARLG